MDKRYTVTRMSRDEVPIAIAWAAKDLVKRYNMEKIFETARMYLKHPPKIMINQIYGITSFELG